jgi:sortase A
VRNSLVLSTMESMSKGVRFLRVICGLLFAFGIVALGYASFLFADAYFYQEEQIELLEEPRASLQPDISRQSDLPAQSGVPAQQPTLAEGDVLGEISVPRLQLDAIVVQGDSPDDLRRAVGHLSNTALPGELGNVALAGHRDTFFRPLRDIRIGDEITFKTQERSFNYVVESTEVVAPTDISVLQPSTGHDLTLLTCYPFHYIGPAPKRFVVFARKVEAMSDPEAN